MGEQLLAAKCGLALVPGPESSESQPLTFGGNDLELRLEIGRQRIGGLRKLGRLGEERQEHDGEQARSENVDLDRLLVTVWRLVVLGPSAAGVEDGEIETIDGRLQFLDEFRDGSEATQVEFEELDVAAEARNIFVQLLGELLSLLERADRQYEG